MDVIRLRPLVLITSSIVENERFLRVSRAYTDAVESAGGAAMVCDCANTDIIDSLLKVINGLLLSGGGDIDPFYFNEEPVRQLGEVTPMRDKFEFELTRRALSCGIPILAICRGAQILNIALGGKVYQDIYAQKSENLIKHTQEMPRDYASHSVSLIEGSKIKRIMKRSNIRVNSFHHQAVSVLAESLEAAGTAPDGMIEAIEHVKADFCIGVQWHPEAMIKKYPEQFEIFRAFISSSKNTI